MLDGMASGMIINMIMNWLTRKTWKHSLPPRLGGQ